MNVIAFILAIAGAGLSLFQPIISSFVALSVSDLLSVPNSDLKTIAPTPNVQSSSSSPSNPHKTFEPVLGVETSAFINAANGLIFIFVIIAIVVIIALNYR